MKNKETICPYCKSSEIVRRGTFETKRLSISRLNTSFNRIINPEEISASHKPKLFIL